MVLRNIIYYLFRATFFRGRWLRYEEKKFLGGVGLQIPSPLELSLSKTYLSIKFRETMLWSESGDSVGGSNTTPNR